MAGKIGIEFGINGDASGLKKAVGEALDATEKLKKESGNIPTFHAESGQVPRLTPAFSGSVAGSLYSRPSPGIREYLCTDTEGGGVAARQADIPLSPPPSVAGSGAKRALDDFASEADRKLGALGRGIPSFHSGSAQVPHLTDASPYGINSFFGRTSPGGVLADQRKTAGSEQKIALLADELAKLGEAIKGVNDDLKEARDAKDIRSEYTLSGTLQNLRATEGRIKNEMKSLEAEKGGGDPAGAFGAFMAANAVSKLTDMAVSAGSTVISGKKALAGGDALGAAIQEEKGLGSLFGSGIGTVIGAAIGSIIAPGVGTAVGAGIGGQLGNFIGGLSGDFKEIDANYSAQYKNALPAIDMFYQRYGTDIETKSAEENSREGLDFYNTASGMSRGTGKTAEELLEAASGRRAYGNFSAAEALTGARQDMMWERFTGADLSNIQRLSGLSLRYGGDPDAVQTAYAGLSASGMGKGQFDEFLTSMQRIMEDGIEKGFAKGAGEIAGNMALLSRLSGGDALWTGEQGANRLMRMDAAVAGATGLKSVEDVVSFSVARDLMGGNGGGREQFKRLMGDDRLYTGTYVDEMMLLERGVSPQMLKGQFEAIRGLEGGNAAGQIERLMNMFGLNYSGGAAVYRMAEDSAGWSDADWNAHADEIKAMQTRPEYKSDSQRLQDVMTDLSGSLVNIGKMKFDEMEMPVLQDQVKKIYGELLDMNGKKDTVDAVDAVAGSIPIRADRRELADYLNEDYLKTQEGGRFKRQSNFILEERFPAWHGDKSHGQEVSAAYRNLFTGLGADAMNDEGFAQEMYKFTNKFNEKAHGGVSENEKNELLALLEGIRNLAAALERNTTATNADSDLTVNVSAGLMK